MLTSEQVSGYRRTIANDAIPRLWQNKTFVAALDTVDALRSRVEALEGVVRELVKACGCEEENKHIIEIMHYPKGGGEPTFSDPEEHCPVCTKALALLATPANEATPERKGGEL